MPQGEWSVSGMVSGIFAISGHALVSIGIMMLRNAFDLCVKSWQYFRTLGIPLNSVSYSLTYDIVRFKIQVGVADVSYFGFVCALYFVPNELSLSCIDRTTDFPLQRQII